MSELSKERQDQLDTILANEKKLKKGAVRFALIFNQFASSEAEADSLMAKAENLATRSKDGREAFYNWLRAGNTVSTVAELDKLKATTTGTDKDGKPIYLIPFSDNQKAKGNNSHWLEIAKLVRDVKALAEPENSTYSEGDKI